MSAAITQHLGFDIMLDEGNFYVFNPMNEFVAITDSYDDAILVVESEYSDMLSFVYSTN